MKITIDQQQDAGRTLQSTLQIARTIKNTMGRSSITRMAQDSIMQFPLLISASIDTDEVATIAKALEKQYAALMVSILSMNNGVNLKKYENLTQYLKKFHNNKDIPSNIKAGVTSMLGTESNMNASIINESCYGMSDIALACWDIIEEQVNETVLNDIYKPYDRTKRILEEKLEIIKTANESSTKSSIKDSITQIGKDISRDEKHISFSGINKGTIEPKSTPAVVRNDRLTAMEPTLINAQFVYYGEGKGQWAQNVVIGIKTMIRLIRSDLMVSNMAEASQDSNAIFKFIKWTKGELKFVRDIIFGISDIKDMATASSKNGTKWWKALKRRKAVNNVSKFFDNKVLPNSTIIMTSYEVARVAELTGVDLSQDSQALSLIAKSYLLGFGIYDTETNILSMMFDGENDFADVTIGALKAGNNKETDLTNPKEMLKLMGRI